MILVNRSGHGGNSLALFSIEPLPQKVAGTLILDSSFNDWTFVILASFCSDFPLLRSTETFAQKITDHKSTVTKNRSQLLLAKEDAPVPLKSMFPL
jgi:hypothetical protein